MTRPEPDLFDLRTEVPPAWNLSGLSAPRWDGVNYFRAPTAPESSLTFPVELPQFMQFRYQVYSPETAVTGRVRLNGELLDTFVFPAGKFVTREVGAFIQPGKQRLTVEYRCGGEPCSGVPLNQYWTQVRLTNSANLPSWQARGLGAGQWRADAPGSPLKISGTEPLLFDGINFYRRITQPDFQISWPPELRPLGVSFYVGSAEPVQVTVKLGDEVLFQGRSAAKAGLAPAISLVGRPEARSLTVRVDCQSGEAGCANLYFNRLSSLTPVSPPGLGGWAGPGALLLALLLLLGWWLRPFPLRRPG
ncbi:hypothetical protein QO006_001434 [Deinococcus enclensis]|uniref:Uncharacterized protein n=1 Tax=Deinococcus enclensis TaxID=1049582 RepID=A0ABT9MCM8_9DEIO|nr:hypothetical protein [Deinococcus enclensis]